MDKRKLHIAASDSYDVCIVGAGIAGAVLASQLARYDYRILVIEKNFKEEKRISGELLQPGGIKCLKEMGLNFLLNGIDAQRVDGYTLYLNDEYFSIPYDREKKLHGYSFINYKFVERVRNYIKRLPQVDLVEGNANELIMENKIVKGVGYLSGKKQYHVYAALTFVCEGALSKLKKDLVKENKKKSSFFIGSLLKNCELPVANHGHVILTGKSPILIYPVNSTEKRILIDFPMIPKMGKELQGYLNKEVRPYLPQTIIPSFDKAVANRNFAGMPNHNLRAYPQKDMKNVALVGDCFNMRHPLTGGGMSAVFNDIRNFMALIATYPDLTRQTNVDRIVSNYYNIRVRDVANINILADSLYRATIDPQLKVASFNYLKDDAHGGDTIRILAGIDKRKFHLIKHFANVVVEGINKLQLNNRKKIELLGKASMIVIPLLLQEGNTKFHKWGNQLLRKFLSGSQLDEKTSSEKRKTSF